MDPNPPGLTARGDRSRGTLLVVASFVISALVTFASLLGLFAFWPYQLETENWVLQARGQDIGNLIAVVLLVVSAIRMRAGSPRAAQLWMGTLLYLLYAYLVYAFAVHFSRLFLVYVAILGLVCYTLIYALHKGEHRSVAPRAAARVFAAWVLIGTGAVFALLWLSELIPATVTGQAPLSLEVAGLIVNPVHVIDLSVVLPGLIIIGVLALRGNETGLVRVVPALVFSVLMGLSIIAAMALIIATGDTSGLVPMVIVAVVVGASLAAAITYSHRRHDAPPAAVIAEHQRLAEEA
ncbi:hypothetical protein E3T23_03760 [Cryobacterium cheniae]|uniref:Uncharacterized protein n=1 Tax=Cryobacterium cheniae TaxID=1259262 RepID=A0A4R8XVG1_9MICO|nr:hypothetical protein [Cryobacterium cheniae]TFC82741.1 hypothetical protein E3T23_03760 [Cryobacterium cheniae]